MVRKKLHCNDIKFTLGCAFFFTVLNALFIQRSWSIIAPAHLHDVLFAASVPLVLFCGWVIVFSLLNIPYIRKPLLIVLTPMPPRPGLCIPMARLSIRT